MDKEGRKKRKRQRPLWELVKAGEHNQLQRQLSTGGASKHETEIKDKYGWNRTPIEWLVQQLTVDINGRWDQEWMRRMRQSKVWEQTAAVLVQHGVDLTNALPQIISHKKAREAADYEYATLVTLMIDKSSQQVEVLNTALRSAILNADAEITRHLLANGADASSPIDGVTPLTEAQAACLGTWCRNRGGFAGQNGGFWGVFGKTPPG